MDFFNYIKSFDMFVLFETHVLEDEKDKFNGIFNNYDLKWIPAIKSNVYGRGSGGELFGYRKNLEATTPNFKRFGEMDVLEVQIMGTTLYIVPIYLNCSNWSRDYDRLCDTLQFMGSMDVLLVGDFNARIGLSQNNFVSGTASDIINPTRRSKDEVCDVKGAKILEVADSLDARVLNGSCQGDPNGEYTFFRGTACSVIDYCFVSGKWNAILKDFRISTQIFSDHMPLEITCLVSSADDNVHTKQLGLLPKLKWRDTFKTIYQNNLNMELEKRRVESIPTHIEDLTQIIIGAVPESTKGKRKDTCKQLWFDAECRKARQKSFSFLRLLRKHNTDLFKSMYAAANKSFKRLCLSKRKQLEEKNVNMLNSSKSSAEFWKAAKTITGRTNTISATLHAYELREHFKSLLYTPIFSPLTHYAAPFFSDDLLDAPFTTDEVQKVIDKSKAGKAPGDDRVPAEFYKNCSFEFVAALTKEYNIIFETATVPASFKRAIIYPLHKKGSYDNPENYRGISFLNTSAKLFSALIFNRLTQWVNDKEILSEFQAGFRRNYSTLDQLFTLFNIAENFKRRKKKLYAFFVDFRSAFDTIAREALFYKLYKLGISSKIVVLLKAMYENNVAYVWDGEFVSEEFTTQMGVKQGCVLSTLLFILFINDIVEATGGGIQFGNIRIPALMFADHIVFLSESVEGMQRTMNRLETYCKLWNLSVNLEKSKMMIFREGGGRHANNEKWRYQGEYVTIVREYKYLGVIVTANLSMRKHFQSKLADAKRAVSSVWNRCIDNKYIDHSSKLKIFRATATSILLYGAQVWGYGEFEEVERFLRYFLKRIFRLPACTPNYMLHLETTVPPLFFDTLKIHFEYIIKILEMDEGRLPKQILEHTLATRGNLVMKWEELANVLGENSRISPEISSMDLSNMFNGILERISHTYYEKFKTEAQSSQYRMIYSKLNFDLKELTYFQNRFSLNMMSVIFKARGEIINLNFIPHRPDLPILCDLCNLKEREDVYHFIARCPILTEFRVSHFGVTLMDLDAVIDVLNGKFGWEILYKYITTALRYRKCIIEGDF